MDPLWIKEMRKAKFEPPSKFLVDIQPEINSRGQDSIKNDRELVEKVSTAFLACGLNVIWGSNCTVDIISSFDDRGTDIDWMLRRSCRNEIEYIPVQVKSHFNEFWSSSPRDSGSYHKFLEEQLVELSKYQRSQEVLFTIHVNKSVSLDIDKLLDLAEDLDFRGLFITGRGNSDGSEYLISGDFVGQRTDFVCERYNIFNSGHFIKSEIQLI